MLKVKSLYLDGGLMGRGRKITVCDSDSPRISWALDSDREDNRQKSCRVRVFDGNVNLFDSGELETSEQSLVVAAKLPHGKILTVTVEATDIYGDKSAAKSAPLVDGVLDASELAGEWISSPESNDFAALYFSSELELREKPVSACLYCAGLGYHELTVNGSPVTDARLEPAHTNWKKLVYYSVYPDASELLREGKNRIEITVADGWRSNRTSLLKFREPEFMGRTQLWAMLRVDYSDGSSETFATDERWSVKLGEIAYSSIYHGETYDASRSSLESVAAVRVAPPEGKLHPMALEPIRHIRDYPCIELTSPRAGVYVADFGQNLAGAVRLTLPESLTAGQEITLRFAEELDEDGTLYTVPLREARQTDRYIASGDSRDLKIWTPKFTYHGFRYCEITGIALPDKSALVAELWSTDLKNASFFKCGSAIVNAIQQMVVMTEADNMHSILTDCPQRDERFGWMNDATVRFEETPYNFDIGRIFPKIVRDIRAEHREEGQIVCCAPFYGGMNPADPVCSSYLIAGYEALMHTGNREIVAESYDGWVTWENYLLSRSQNFIVDYAHYGDWAGPVYACAGEENPRSKTTPPQLMSTGFSYFNCKLLAHCAEMLGKDDDVTHFSHLAEKIREAFLKTWQDPETRLIANGAHGATALAVKLGILPESERQAAVDLLADDLVKHNYRFNSGNICTRYLFDILAEYGHIDVAYAMLTNEKYPSFGYMLQNEATTVWERFELKKSGEMNSHNHPMYGAIGSFFYEHLAGIKPLEPGFARVRIAPKLPTELTSAQCVVDTVRGDLAVRWSKRYGKAYLFVQIPFGAVAEVTFGGEKRELTSGYHVLEYEL